jgi:hypothetical protein
MPLYVLFQCDSSAGLRIRITLMQIRIRIQLFTLLRSRLFTSMWIQMRILLLIKEGCESATTGRLTLHGSISSLQTSIVSAHCPPCLHCEPLKLLNLTLMQIRVQLFALMQIRIRTQSIKIICGSCGSGSATLLFWINENAHLSHSNKLTAPPAAPYHT